MCVIISFVRIALVPRRLLVERQSKGPNWFMSSERTMKDGRKLSSLGKLNSNRSITYRRLCAGSGPGRVILAQQIGKMFILNNLTGCMIRRSASSFALVDSIVLSSQFMIKNGYPKDRSHKVRTLPSITLVIDAFAGAAVRAGGAIRAH